jgi:hypothetical protein
MEQAFANFKISTVVARSEREELITYFFDNLKEPYRAFTKRALTPRLVAIKLAHIKNLSDLYYLKSVCSDSDNFSWTFWSRIKAK